MENTSPAREPRFLWVLIIVLLASMYTYAAYFDPASPEKTVENFYQAYFTKDYNAVASNSSVFWAVRFLPQYAEMTPTELVNNRAKIEADIIKVIASMEKSNPIPKDIRIEIMKEYTKKGNYGAIVVYQFKEAGKTGGMEAAILIKEAGRFRIFTMTTVDPQGLDQVKAVDVNELDANFLQLLTPEE